MKKTYRSGRIFVAAKYREDVIYDVCANDLKVTFDGKGGIAKYSLCNQSGRLLWDCTLTVFVGGKKLDPFCQKRVKLIGRMMSVFVKSGKTQIEICQFVVPNDRAVFYEIKTNKPGDYDFALDLNHSRNGFHFVSDAAMERYVDENMTIHLHVTRSARLVLSYDSVINCERLLSRFTEYKKQVEDEIRQVKIPASAKTERDKAIYLSGVFSALENYKEIGSFRGFSAGAHMDAPIRTYFQDGYWTGLCLYRNRPDLIRNQILTLAQGIENNGDCPAGVTFDFRPRRRNYYDSPCFFVLTVFDYVNHTGDRSILSETVNGKTVYDWCLLTLSKLSEYEDRTGLIVKAGKYNSRDWADQINRTGYVTYVELLYARALSCLAKIVGTRDPNRALRYSEMYARTKNAINEYLWDDEKGYYINCRDGNFTEDEDNLSVDTILAVLFGISDEKQTARLLDNFTKLLETRNNPNTRLGDFGVASVYPCYRGIDRCFSRSVVDYDFQNGAAWPYWSALVAYAQMRHGRDYTYALTSPFEWNVKRGNYTPVECYSPNTPDGSPLHAASSVVAWVYDWSDEDFFRENQAVWKTK
ncbi:MAG: hypothetical protein J5958_02590 [Clostridia bacterium]|nr:hypothetical protein [Clostridia bacterium]